MSGAALAAAFAVQVSAASAAATSCASTITGKSIPGDVIVPSGKTCTLVGVAVDGSVTVNGKLIVKRGSSGPTTISDDLVSNAGSGGVFATANGALVVGLNATFHSRTFLGCEQFLGDLTLSNTDGVSSVIDGGSSTCNGVFGNVALASNTETNSFKNYSIYLDLAVHGNTAVQFLRGLTVYGDGNITNNKRVDLINNTFDGDLNCSGNTPAPTGSGNTVGGSANGQCATLG